jgi:hypothetical protein
MPGQIANYTRNFSKIVDYVRPYINVLNKVLGSIGTAYSIFTNLNKLHDPNATQKDKAVDIAKAAPALTSLIPNPIIAPIATRVVEAASYLTDLQEGRKDAPPKPENVNTRTNPM